MASIARYKQFISSAEDDQEFVYIPSSLISLNRAIGDSRGIRSGRLIQIVGNPSAGKTTLALDFIENAQHTQRCAYIDFERTFDKTYAQALGVDTKALTLVKPDTAETGLDIIEALIKEDDYQYIVIDSVPAAVPADESDKDMTDSAKMAVAAGFWTRFIRRAIPLVDSRNATIIFLNQFRANISTLSRIEQKPYGPKMLQYGVSLTIELTRIKNEDVRTTVQAKITKNKLGTERGMCEFDIIYGKGLDIAGDVLNLAVLHGIIKKTGAWYTWNEIRAQGLNQCAEKFDINAIRQEVLHEFSK